MKKYILLILFLLIARSSLAEDFHPEVAAELATSHFWADISFQPDSNVAVVEFRVWFEFPVEKVFPALININAFPQVHAKYTDAMALSKSSFDAIVAAKPQDAAALQPYLNSGKTDSYAGRASGNSWTRYEYASFNFPWPLANRWSVQKTVIDESQARDGIYRYDYKMAVGNFTTLSGAWTLMPVPGKPGWSEFRGRYESDPGIPIPKFIAKIATRTGMKRDVDDNRRILAKE